MKLRLGLRKFFIDNFFLFFLDKKLNKKSSLFEDQSLLCEVSAGEPGPGKPKKIRALTLALVSCIHGIQRR